MPLFSYKLTADTGFGPNPFHNYLTLATCKPGIRRSGNRHVGDWIAGFTSVKLCGDAVGHERLVYLMRVDLILPLQEYFCHPEFQSKIPLINAVDPIQRVGDNIYRALIDNPQDAHDYEQVQNYCHGAEDAQNDLSGLNVLVSNTGDFFYFGRNALVIPDDVRPSIPHRASCYGCITHDEGCVDRFLEFVRQQFNLLPGDFPEGMKGWPHGGCDVVWPGD